MKDYVRYYKPSISGEVSLYTTTNELGVPVNPDVTMKRYLDRFGVGHGTSRNRNVIRLRIKLDQTKWNLDN